jgi:MFS family permease
VHDIAAMTRNRWSVLALLTTAELLGMSLWFTASAVSPHFRSLWNLTAGEAGWLTTVVQLGFVTGTALAAALNLADILPSRLYFAVAGVAAAAANALLVVAPTFHSALVLRFVTGLLLAGVYPPAMKMIATWFVSSRGLAIGMIVGGLTLGKALPYLISSFGAAGYRGVILLASAGAVVGATAVAVAYRDGPYPFPRREFSWSLVPSVFAHRETRLAIFGYLGHMWELYAMWAAASVFFFDYFAARGNADVHAMQLAGIASFAVIAIGAAGSVAAGVWADRIGREVTAAMAMTLSAACALSIGWLFSAPPWVVITVSLIWGFAVVADSAQFSALVTEVAPRDGVGTALTLQTSLGFLLTAFTIGMTFWLRENFGWTIAFSVLAIGPLTGIVPMIALRRSSMRRQGMNRERTSGGGIGQAS